MANPFTKTGRRINKVKKLVKNRQTDVSILNKFNTGKKLTAGQSTRLAGIVATQGKRLRRDKDLKVTYW